MSPKVLISATRLKPGSKFTAKATRSSGYATVKSARATVGHESKSPAIMINRGSLRIVEPPAVSKGEFEEHLNCEASVATIGCAGGPVNQVDQGPLGQSRSRRLGLFIILSLI